MTTVQPEGYDQANEDPAIAALNKCIDSLRVPPMGPFSPLAEEYLAKRAVSLKMARQCGVRSITQDDMTAMWPDKAPAYGEALLIPVLDDADNVVHRRAVLLDPNANEGRKAHSPDERVPPFFVFPEQPGSNDALYICESPVKAMALADAGYANVMGLGGVDVGWHPKGSRSLHPDLAKRVRPGRPVVIVFDRDRAKKPQVALAEARLALALREAKAEVFTVSLPDGQSSGPDDFIHANGADAFHALVAAKLPSCPKVRAEAAKTPEEFQALLRDMPFLAALFLHRKDDVGALVLKAFKKVGLGPSVVKREFEGFETIERDRAAKIENERNPNKLRFKRGDEKELGDYYVKSLSLGAVFDQGDVWKYSESRGIYVVQTKADACHFISELAGTTVEPDGSPPFELKMSSKVAKGAFELACFRLAAGEDKRDFFERARRGLAFSNGFVALDPLGVPTLEQHSRDNRCRTAYEFAYNPTATCPKFLQFLRELWSPNFDRQARIDMLQEFVGATLFGLAPVYKRCLFFKGESNCGKSTLQDMIRGLFPAKSVISIEMTNLDDKFRLGELPNKLLNIVAEVPGGDFLTTESFKKIISGDPVTGERKNRDPITFQPVAGHIFASNNPPRLGDRSKATFERLEVLTFDQEFSTRGEAGTLPMVRGLVDAILAEERAGIVAWAVAGLARLKAAGAYTHVPSSVAAKLSWRKDSNPVERFFDEEVYVDPNAPAAVPTTKLFERYKDWAQRENLKHTLSNNQFGKDFAKVFAEKVRGGASTLLHGYTAYKGIQLSGPQTAPADYNAVLDVDTKMAAE